MNEQPRLHHLLDRLRHGVLLEAEGEQLAGLVSELEKSAANLRVMYNVASNRESDLIDERDHLQAEIASAAEAAVEPVYRERAHLVAHLAALHPAYIDTDPNAPDFAVVIIETPAGQMSWHIAPRDMDLFTHVQPVNRICRGWDGHTTDEKYQRMRDLTEAAPNLLGQDQLIEAQARRITELKTQVARLTAGQCTHALATEEQQETDHA